MSCFSISTQENGIFSEGSRFLGMLLSINKLSPFRGQAGFSLPTQGTNSRELRMYFQAAGGTLHSPCSRRNSPVTTSYDSPIPTQVYSNPSLPLQVKVPTLDFAENSPSLPCLRRRKPSGAAFTTLSPHRSSPLEASHCSPNPSSWVFLRPHLLKKEHTCELVTTPKALP